MTALCVHVKLTAKWRRKLRLDRRNVVDIASIHTDCSKRIASSLARRTQARACAVREIMVMKNYDDTDGDDDDDDEMLMI